MIDKQKFINDFSAVIHDLANKIMAVYLLQLRQKNISVPLAEFKILKKKVFLC